MPSEYVVRTAEGETAEGGSSSGSDRTIPVKLIEVNSRPWFGWVVKRWCMHNCNLAVQAVCETSTATPSMEAERWMSLGST